MQTRALCNRAAFFRGIDLFPSSDVLIAARQSDAILINIKNFRRSEKNSFFLIYIEIIIYAQQHLTSRFRLIKLAKECCIDFRQDEFITYQIKK